MIGPAALLTDTSEHSRAEVPSPDDWDAYRPLDTIADPRPPTV
jgi:hypothetical protein